MSQASSTVEPNTDPSPPAPRETPDARRMRSTLERLAQRGAVPRRAENAQHSRTPREARRSLPVMRLLGDPEPSWFKAGTQAELQASHNPSANIIPRSKGMHTVAVAEPPLVSLTAQGLRELAGTPGDGPSIDTKTLEHRVPCRRFSRPGAKTRREARTDRRALARISHQGP